MSLMVPITLYGTGIVWSPTHSYGPPTCMIWWSPLTLYGTHIIWSPNTYIWCPHMYIWSPNMYALMVPPYLTINDSYDPPYLIWNRYLMVPPYLLRNSYCIVPPCMYCPPICTIWFFSGQLRKKSSACPKENCLGRIQIIRDKDAIFTTIEIK